MNFSTALVTGATGFIGSALVKRLVENGIHVICLTKNIQANKRYSNVEYLYVKEYTLPELTSVLRNYSAEVVFHLASYGVRPEDRDSYEMLAGNTHMITALLNAVKCWPLKNFIYTGSCAEYATANEFIPIAENYSLVSESLYGAAKSASGIYGRCLAKHFNLPFTHLRLFGVYGSGEANYRLIPHLIRKLSLNEKADLSEGNQTRDFLYIDDVIDALMHSVDLITKSNIYNICSSIPVTVRDIAHEVRMQLKKPENLVNFGSLPYRPDEVMWLVGNNSSFKSATGWSPQITLKKGIEFMVQNYLKSVVLV